jgi:type VI secretion system protein ImpE
LRDCDDTLATVLEVFAQGHYWWVPFEQIQILAINPPRFARDLLWLPARLITREGLDREVYLPTIYPGTHEHSDDQVRLGRKVDWQPLANGLMRGIGSKIYLAGDHDVGLADWRELQVN